MNDPKNEKKDLLTETATAPIGAAQLTLSDDELKMLDEGELAEVAGGLIGFPPCASAN